MAIDKKGTLNKVWLTGYVTNRPRLFHNKKDCPFVILNMQTHCAVGKREGAHTEVIDHRIIFYGDIAPKVVEECQPGFLVFVSGDVYPHRRRIERGDVVEEAQVRAHHFEILKKSAPAPA